MHREQESNPSWESRAAGRRSWAVRKFWLGEEPEDCLDGSTSPEERLAMMWPLTLEAWSFAGRPLPKYSRREAPVRRLRGPGSADSEKPCA